MSKISNSNSFVELIKQSAWFWVSLFQFIVFLIFIIGTLLVALINPDRVNVENLNQNQQTVTKPNN